MSTGQQRLIPTSVRPLLQITGTYSLFYTKDHAAIFSVDDPCLLTTISVNSMQAAGCSIHEEINKALKEIGFAVKHTIQVLHYQIQISLFKFFIDLFQSDNNKKIFPHDIEVFRAHPVAIFRATGKGNGPRIPGGQSSMNFITLFLINKRSINKAC